MGTSWALNRNTDALPNEPDTANPTLALLFHFDREWRGVADSGGRDTERTGHISQPCSLVVRCVALSILYASIGIAGAAEGAGEQDMFDKFIGRAKSEIAEKPDKFRVGERSDALLAKLSILESKTDLLHALSRARAITNPFYSSLALGGVAATEMRADPMASTNHFYEALTTSLRITKWTGTNATSLGFLFGLVPHYTKEEAPLLLAACRQALGAWKRSDYEKSASLLALCKATTLVAPDRVEELLLDVALKRTHSGRSIEHLARFMFIQSPDKALRLAEAHYQAKKNWIQDKELLCAVLVELAKTDFPKAFEEVKRMREGDQEFAAARLAEAMLTAKREREAEEVIKYISTPNMIRPGREEALDRLRSQLKDEGRSLQNSPAATPETVDDFLRSPASPGLRLLAGKAIITFRDMRQVHRFIEVALPLADSLYTEDLYHGSPRSTALGLLLMCSTLAGETEQGLEISRRIGIPELRISYLLDAAEYLRPMPSPVSDWPVHFWHRVSVSTQEKRSPNQVPENTARKLADPQH